MKLKHTKGILAKPYPIGAKSSLNESTKKAVIDFYLNDEQSYSRQLPGQKDKVGISKNLHAQKDYYCVT